MNKFISIFILSIFIISSVSAQTDGYQAGGLSNGSVYIKNTNNKPMNFFTADTQRMTLDSTGKLGIGTSNPSYMLELKSSGPMRPAILLNNTSTSNNNNFILFKGPNSQFNLYQWSAGQLLNISSDLNAETHIMRLWRDSSAVTIPNGNLGVGTDGQTNLTNRLHVVAPANPVRFVGLVSGAASDSILTADINGVIRRRSPLSIAASSEPWFNQATKTGATLNTQNIYQLGNVMIGDTFSGAYYSSALGVKMPPSNGSNAGIVFRTTGTVKNPGLFMHADTTSGAYIMDFSGTTGYQGQIRVGGSNVMNFNNNLNVGIGTITPTAKLTVQGAYLSRQALFGYDAANGNGLSIRADGTNTHFNWQIDQQGVTSGLNFVPSTVAGGTTFSTPTMTLLETGNVGIGYVSPTNKLHVRATANPVKLEGLQVGAATDSIITADIAGVLRKRSATDVAASSEPWYNQATGTGATANTQNIYQMGNIGIGTNNPTRKLHVVGDVLVAPTASTGVVYIGNGLSGGNRTWMTKGIQVSSTSDNLYVGLKDEGSNNEDAVIAWGDDGGDDLRFINVISGGDTNGIEAMRIVGVSNFVGVNTIAPTNRLHVFSTSNPLRLEGLQSGVSSDSILTVDGTGVVRKRTASSVASSIEPWFNKLTGTGATSNTDSVYIMGKVGIATNTPITQLQIGANHGNNGGYLQINLDNTAPVEQTQGVKTSVIRTTGFNWGVNGTAWGVGATRNTGLYGYAAGATENWGLHVDTGLSIIDNRMGIGTSTPFSMLHVTDKIISGTNAATNGTSIIEGRYSQTSSSDDALNIFGSMYSSGGTMLSYGARAASFLSTDSFTSSTAVPLNRDALILDNLGYRFFTGANQTTAIGNGLSMSEKMRLTSAGFLGIGTTSPTDKLNVKSLTGAQQGITFEDDTINFRIYRDADVPNWTNFRAYGGLGMAVIGQPDIAALTVSRHTGNVGVNTTLATNTLDVNGSVRVRTLASGAAADSIVTADANGVLRKRTLSSIVSASGGWSLLGNAGTSAATNFIGTTDNTDLIIKRNNQAAFSISSSEIYTGAFYLRAIGLGNYSSDIGDGTIQTHGINSFRFALGTGSNGYLGALTNNNSSGAGSVLLLKTNTTSAASKILNVLTNSTTPLGAGSTVLVAQGDSKVGIATGSPNSTAHINGSFSTAISLKTAAYTATEADHILICNGTFTLTLPTAVGIAGREYIIKNTGFGTVTIDGAGAETIDGASTIPLSVQWTVRTIVSDGANWLIINNQ